MKAAVSIPDPVYQEAERLSRRLKKSRSELYSQAVAEFVARHAPDQVTDAMNQVCTELGAEREGVLDEFVAAAARRTMERSEW
jgi:metal-responsive CopG/Arc/MetJ family transcriptional regulator